MPFAARAQKPAISVIGFLSGASPAQWPTNVAAFRHGLTEAGFAEGKNVASEFHWAEGHYDRLPVLVAFPVCDAYRPVGERAGTHPRRIVSDAGCARQGNLL